MSYLASAFQKAHDYVKSTTGVGFQEANKSGLDELVRKLCPYYLDLLPVMGNSASVRLHAANEDAANEEDVSEDDVSEDDDDDQEGDGDVVHVAEDESSASSFTNPSGRNPSSSSKRARAASIASSSNKSRRTEISIPGFVKVDTVEELAKVKLALVKAQIAKIESERSKIERETSLLDHNAMLQMVSDCEKFVADHPLWSKQRILRLFPKFKDALGDVMGE